MYIIIDKNTNKIKQTININYGIQVNANELLQEVTNKALENKILSAYDYNLVFDEKGKVIDINIIKTIDQYRQEQSQLPTDPSMEDYLIDLDFRFSMLELGL